MNIEAKGKMYFDGIQGVILLKSDDDVINEIKEVGMNEILDPEFLKLKKKGAYSFVMKGTIDDGERFYTGIRKIKKIDFNVKDLI